MGFTSTLTHNVLQPGGGSVTKLYRMNEKRRQGMINLGEQQINAVYEGGTVPTYKLADYTGQKFNGQGAVSKEGYFKQKGNGQFVPVTNPTSKMLRQGRLFYSPESKTYTGFNDEFFADREKAYKDYAMPQVAQQYRDARANTIYGLANRGQLGSSIASDATSRLERTSAQARQAVVDNAIDQSSQLRRDLEQARAASLQNLYQSTDPSKAVSAAIATSQQYRRPSSFAPIVNAFANLANTYATNQAIQGYNQQAAAYNKADQSSTPTYFAPIE